MKEASHKSAHFIWFHLYKTSRVGQSIEPESRWVISQGWEMGRRGRGAITRWLKQGFVLHDGSLKLIVLMLLEIWVYEKSHTMGKLYIMWIIFSYEYLVVPILNYSGTSVVNQVTICVITTLIFDSNLHEHPTFISFY